MSDSAKYTAFDRMAKVGPRAAAKARHGKNRKPDALRVGIVADRIGIAKTELRRILEMPEFADKIIPKDSSGVKRGVLIPEILVPEIAAALHFAKPSPQPKSAQSEGVSEQAPNGGSQPTGMSLAIIYERLLAEKDARIDDLKSEIATLRSIIEREQRAVARTQALLSIQAPTPIITQESSSDVVQPPVSEAIIISPTIEIESVLPIKNMEVTPIMDQNVIVVLVEDGEFAERVHEPEQEILYDFAPKTEGPLSELIDEVVYDDDDPVIPESHIGQPVELETTSSSQIRTHVENKPKPVTKSASRRFFGLWGRRKD